MSTRIATASPALRPRTAETRFWRLVDTAGGPDACWPWMGRRTPEGYGIKHLGKRRVAANRMALKYSGIELPDDKNACHSCDNPPCCNPAHLFVGTQAANVADCISKGRFVMGERNGSAKLTQKAAVSIRCDPRTQMVIAADFGISQSLVSAIKCGLRWKEAA